MTYEEKLAMGATVKDLLRELVADGEITLGDLMELGVALGAMGFTEEDFEES